MTTAIKIQMPSAGHTNTIELGEDKIAFLAIHHDQCFENPLDDWDGVGTIYSFNKRHVNFCHPDELPDEYREHSVLLSYFEHGACAWGVQGTMCTMPDFEWDGVKYAGVWYPDKHVMEAMPEVVDSVEDWLQKQADHACRLYTDWCNGSVYWYRVAVYDAIKKPCGSIATRWDTYEEVGHEIIDDSCGGYFGYEHEASGLQDAVLDSLRYALGDDYEIEA